MNQTAKAAAAVVLTLGAAFILVLVTMSALPGPGPMGRGSGDGRAAFMHMHGPAADMHSGSEYDYLAEMVPHHEEAIVAASQLSRSERPELRQLGRDIVASQRAQVRLMEGWLAEWYPDRPARDPDYRPMMRDLGGLSGEALDRAFLIDMIPHHMMAVMSSQHLLIGGRVEHPEVADLAESIRDEQRVEIAVMRRWLAREGDGDGGAGACPGLPGGMG